MKRRTVGSIIALELVVSLVTPAVATATTFTINGADPGRTYQGVGALSAGASTRLLQDYPATQKTQILDYLFKPNYGASLEHLKVEIGGDTNSTDGSEPSFLRTRAEFDTLNADPTPDATTCHLSRGYEWWLLSQAKSRNSAIILDALAWGFPGWINEGSPYAGDVTNVFNNWRRFFTPVAPATVSEAVTYLVDFAKCATANGTPLNYIGVWNEADYLNVYGDYDQPEIDVARQFIVDLRIALNAAGYSSVGIVGGDINWEPIVGIVTAPTPGVCNSFPAGLDRDFCNAIAVIGAHYPTQTDPSSTAAAQQVGKPLWASEETPGQYGAPFDTNHALRGTWTGARFEAQHVNWQFVDGKMQKSQYWSPVSAYYDELPYSDGGLVYAKEPWSGHYDVMAMAWVLAHTTQYATPNTWRYIDSASCFIGTASCTTRAGNSGSYVTLRQSSGTSNVPWSMVVETVDATANQTHTFCLSGGLKTGTLRVRLTNATNNFIAQPNIATSGGCFAITLLPDSLYTISTLTTAAKGNAGTPPTSQAFPFPYSEDFESFSLGVTPKWISDQQGTFEIGCGVGESKCLEQKARTVPIPWQSAITTQTYTLVGSPQWADYEVKVGLNAPNPDSSGAAVWGRVHAQDAFVGEPGRYQLSILNNGDGTMTWYLYDVDDFGTSFLEVASGVASYVTYPWVNVTLRMNGSNVQAWVDGVQKANWTDPTPWTKGQVGLGDAYGGSKFDVLCVQAVSGSSC